LKGSLIFDLPEEQTEFYIAQNGIHYLSILQELDNYLRGKIKYESEIYSEESLINFDEIRSKLHDLLKAQGLLLHE
jgi:hypothetical protein